jgi:hypothetical protein
METIRIAIVEILQAEFQEALQAVKARCRCSPPPNDLAVMVVSARLQPGLLGPSPSFVEDGIDVTMRAQAAINRNSGSLRFIGEEMGKKPTSD